MFNTVLATVLIIAIAGFQVFVSQIWIGFKPTKTFVYLFEVFAGYMLVSLIGTQQQAAGLVRAIALGTLVSALWSLVLRPWLHRHPHLAPAAPKGPVTIDVSPVGYNRQGAPIYGVPSQQRPGRKFSLKG